MLSTTPTVRGAGGPVSEPHFDRTLLTNFALLYSPIATDYLIFRHVGESGVPFVRMMAWFKDPNLRIVGMSFNHSAQWLVCVASDMSIFVLSIYFMMVRGSAVQPLKVIQTTRYSREKKFHFSDVKCWRSGAGVEYAIITTTPGNVRLINLSNGEYFKVKAKTSLAKFHILTEPGGVQSRPSTWLLIESPGHGFYRLLIGHYLDSGKYEDIAAPGASQKQEFGFFATSISKHPNALLSVQQSLRGPIVLIYEPDTRVLQILDSNLRVLFKYNLKATADVKSVHVTENLIFVLTNPPNDTTAPTTKLIVYSRILSEEKRAPSSPYQEFALPVFERVKGPFFPGFMRPLMSTAQSPDAPAPDASSSVAKPEVDDAESMQLESSKIKGAPKYRPKSVRSYVEVNPLALKAALDGNFDESPSPSLQQGADGMFSFAHRKSMNVTSTGPSAASSSASSNSSSPYTSSSSAGNSGAAQRKALVEFLDERSELVYEESWVDESRTEGVYFWTEDSLYQLSASHTPEELFFRFMEKKHGEGLGLTFALDMCKLYELAADERFRRGQLGEAAALYHLSNVSTPKLIRQWLSVGRMDEPISTLRVLLLSGRVGEARRPRVAHELIRCHVQRLLNPSKHSNLLKLMNINERCRDEELENFLKNNPDFDETETRNFFTTLGLLRFDLIVAQSKRHLKSALDSLSLQRGISYLSMEHLRFISENNAIETGTLKVEDANTLISHFPPHIQLLHYLTAVSNIQNTLPRINDLLAELDDESLAKVCRFFDPQGPFLGPMIHSQDHVHLQQMRSQSPQQRRTKGHPGSDSSSEHLGTDSPSTSASYSSSKSGAYLDSRHFVSQCVELFLVALIRLNRSSHALPQSWKAAAPASAPSSSEGLRSPPRKPRSDSNDGRSSMKSSSDSIGGRSGSLGSLSASSESHGITHATPSSSGLMRSSSTEERGLSPRRGRGIEASNSAQALRGLKLRKAVDVHCGFHHTALLTETGQVFTWGAGSKGQLGHENVSDSLWVPRLVSGLYGSSLGSGDRVTKVACGANHTLAFTASGLLFAFGSNARGQLGLGDREDRFEPRQVILGEKIRHEMASSNTASSASSTPQSQSLYTQVPSSPSPSVGTLVDISAGFWHSVIVTDKGVWISGANSVQDANAAGLHSDTADLLSFAPVPNIPIDETYVMARCGFAHTALLTKRGRVYTFGSNEHGQLGIGDYNGDSVAWNSLASDTPVGNSESGLSFSASPVHVRGLLADKHVIHIACGSFSTFAVSEVYSVYAWGQNSKGQLGIISGSSRRKPSTGGFADSGGSHHDSGSSGSSRDERLPARIDALQGLEISRVYAGPSHAFATSLNGKVYVWGDCNTTMKAKTADPRLPALVNRWTDSRISFIGCGDDFTVTILENGLVYTFGRGVCGQLGHNDEHDNWEARQAFLNTSLGLDAASDFSSSPHHHQDSGIDSLSSSFNSDHGLSGSLLSNASSSSGVTSPIASNAGGAQPSSGSRQVSGLRIQSPLPLGQDNGLSSISEEEEAGNNHAKLSLHESTALNNASAVSTYSDPGLLDECLRVLKKRFRPAIILQQAYVAENLAAAAVILEQCHAWEAAIDCKIRLLQKELPKLGSARSQQTHLMVEMMKDLAQPEVSPLARVSGLKHILGLWQQFGAPPATLEARLLSSTPLTVAAASLLESEDLSRLGLKFSPRFMLMIVKTRLDTQKRATSPADVLGPGTPIRKPQSASHSNAAGDSKLSNGLLARDPIWAERKATLEKELKVRTKIQISQPALEDFIQHNGSASSSSSSRGRSGSGIGGAMPDYSNAGDLVFTCGHMFSHRRFTQSTLQLFREKMARFPVQLPLTVKLLTMDYSNGSCTSACPACVYNHLREKHAPNLERWNPQ